MANIYEDIAESVLAIKSDPQLVECFNRVLKFGSSTQQARVTTLLKELEEIQAPDKIKNFVRLLGNDILAHQVLEQINKQ